MLEQQTSIAILDNLRRGDKDVSGLIKNLDGVVSTLVQGQVLYYEGLRPLGIFFIRKGKIKILKEYPIGKDKMVSIVKSHQTVGVKDFLSGNFYKYTAVALEDTEIFFLEASKFQRLLTVTDFKKTFLQVAGHN